MARAAAAVAVSSAAMVGSLIADTLTVEPLVRRGAAGPPRDPLHRASKNPRSKRVKPASQARRKAKLKAGQRRRRAK